MDLLAKKEKNDFQTFSCCGAKVKFDNNGYIINAKGFMNIMWSHPNQDKKLIGKHITELARMLKQYAVTREIYINFLEDVVLEFYESKEKDNINTIEIKEEKMKRLIKNIDKNKMY